MKYKAIIFDLFGTLVDRYELVAYASALRETSSLLKIPHNDFMKLWNETEEKRTTGVFKTLEENLVFICRELNIPVKQFDIKLAKMVRYDFISLSLTPRRYAIETLSQLKTDGYKMAVITNCAMEPPEIWPQTPFMPFFEAAIFSSIAGIKKPDPRIYLMAAEKLGVKPEDCLYVDDNSDNLTPSVNAGMGAVLVRYPDESGEPPPVEQKDEWPGAVITSVEEILDLLEEQNEV